MHSRAYLLLQRDLERLRKDPAWGIYASPVSDLNMFEWKARISGPRETEWQDGVFQLRLRFSSEYSCKPPEVIFMTIPFHPNIDMDTGKPCTDLLDEPSCWNEKLHGVQYVLLSIQAMLADPVLENPANAYAARCWSSSPRMYRQMVLDCVAASRRVAAGLPAHEEEEEERQRVATEQEELRKLAQEAEQQSSQRKPTVTRVSFNDYHLLWRGLATTQPTASTSSPLIRLLRKDRALRAVHVGSSLKTLDEAIEGKMRQFQDLKYGRAKSVAGKQGDKRKTQKDKQAGNKSLDPQKFKERRMQMLRQLYMSDGEDGQQESATDTESRLVETAGMEEKESMVAHSVSGSICSLEICIPSHSSDPGEGDLEAEAEKLLIWTDQLTDDALNT